VIELDAAFDDEALRRAEVRLLMPSRWTTYGTANGPCTLGHVQSIFLGDGTGAR
jgi:hypothetical protein